MANTACCAPARLLAVLLLALALAALPAVSGQAVINGLTCPAVNEAVTGTNVNLPSTSGKTYLLQGPGPFTIHNSIALTSGTTTCYIGAGQSTAVIRLTGDVGEGGFTLSDSTKLGLQGLTVDGQNTYGRAAGLHIGAALHGQDVAFRACRGSDVGGALSAGASSLIRLAQALFANNTAPNDGGAVFLFQAQLDLDNATFAGNSGRFGGAIASQSSALRLNQVTLNDNAGTGDGGAINSVGDNVNITACAFNRNTAARGGAMYTQDGATVAIKQTTFVGNSAGNGGALIALSAASFNVSGCSFLHNTATEDGGAMVSGSPLHVEESTFEDNAAGQDGGALGLFNAAPMVLRNTRFARNSANETGGAISAAVTTVTVQGSFVCSNNTAAFAGCAYVGTRATLAFVDGADGSASDVRGNTPHDIFVFRASNVTCGASGQPWAAPNNYTICGSACACNAAFVAGTSSDCPCSRPPPSGPCAGLNNGNACTWTTSRYGAPPKTHQGYATVKYTWASEAKAHKLADRNGVTAWGPCNGVCMGGYCKLDEPTDMSACCVPAAGPHGYLEAAANDFAETEDADEDEADGTALGTDDASVASHGRYKHAAHSKYLCWKVAHAKHGE